MRSVPGVGTCSVALRFVEAKAGGLKRWWYRRFDKTQSVSDRNGQFIHLAKANDLTLIELVTLVFCRT